MSELSQCPCIVNMDGFFIQAAGYWWCHIDKCVQISHSLRCLDARLGVRGYRRYCSLVADLSLLAKLDLEYKISPPPFILSHYLCATERRLFKSYCQPHSSSNNSHSSTLLSMLSFVRDFFIAAIARRYLTEAPPGRKSAGPASNTPIKQEVLKATTTCDRPQERCEGISTSKELQDLALCSGIVIQSGHTVNAPILEVPIKNTETSPSPSEKGSSEIVGDNTVHHGPQALPATTAPSGDPTKHKRALRSADDSGYASENSSTKSEITASSKTDKMRRARKRVSDKFKKIWRKASNAIQDPQLHGCVDSKEPDAVLESNTVHDEAEVEIDYEYDGPHPRCDFKTVEATPNERIEALVSLHCDDNHDATDIRVVHRTKGVYNFVAIVSLSCQEEVHRYIVRIPGHATLAHWITEDAYIIEREVQLIQHIGKNTTTPVATIVHYSTEHSNSLGLQYVLMTELPGKPALAFGMMTTTRMMTLNLSFDMLTSPALQQRRSASLSYDLWRLS
jgi:hypothetical protein